MKDDIIFVGLDVSKETISVGVAPRGAREAARYFGTIEHRPEALSSLCKKLSRDGSRLHFCYEAAPSVMPYIGDCESGAMPVRWWHRL
jgi:hypothetical protein